MANLRSIQKRCIDELFAEDIPEDEVIMMNTGKYSCKVCHHRPVFDTVNVLALHRSSKKHLQNIEQKKVEDKELFNLVAKRKHEQFMKDGTIDIEMAPEVKRRVDHIAGDITRTLQAQPYDPRVKKPKVKRHERRPKISIDTLTTSDRDSPSDDVPSLPEPSKQFLLGSKLALNIGNHKDSIELNPYIRKHSKTPSRPALDKLEPRTDKQTTVLDKLETMKPKSASSNENNFESPTTKKLKTETSNLNPPRVYNPEQQKKAEYYLKLREAGWVKDRGGNWIKDENAEFDSDEEEPPDMS